MPGWSTARGPSRPGHVALSWPAGVLGARAQVAAGLDLRLKRFAHTLNGRDGGAMEGVWGAAVTRGPSAGGIKTSASSCARPPTHTLLLPMIIIVIVMTVMLIIMIMYCRHL